MKNKRIYLITVLAILSIGFMSSFVWGFYAHQLINRLAVYTLPDEMIGFYKANIDYVTENAVNPDRRRYAVEGEAPRHYIDLDYYTEEVQRDLANLSWSKAVAKYTEDTLNAYGVVPWHVVRMKFQLTEAFAKKDLKNILRISADVGHYIADAHVPLHTTENYNGQLTDQLGIHGFWESRLPELYTKDYSFWVGKADYIDNIHTRIWDVVLSSHACLDSVFGFEKELTLKMGEDKKFAVGERNGRTVREYSKDFSKRYNKMLDGQVEKRMRSSVKTVGDFWYTCWIDAGQPDLDDLGTFDFEKSEEEILLKKSWLRQILKVRKEADDS